MRKSPHTEVLSNTSIVNLQKILFYSFYTLLTYSLLLGWHSVVKITIKTKLWTSVMNVFKLYPVQDKGDKGQHSKYIENKFCGKMCLKWSECCAVVVFTSGLLIVKGIIMWRDTRLDLVNSFRSVSFRVQLERLKSRTIEANTPENWGRAEPHWDSPPLRFFPAFPLLLRCQSRRRAERSHAQPGSFTYFTSIQSCSLSRQVQRIEEVRNAPKTAVSVSPCAERCEGSSSLSGLN